MEQQNSNMKKGLIIAYILLIIWMSLIFWFSNQKAAASDNLSGGPIKTAITFIYNVIGKEINETEINELVDNLNGPVRKIGHITEYFILGLLVINVVSRYPLNKRKTIVISSLIAVLYACSDEFHQVFIDGRSGEILDVLIDSIGITIGIYLFCHIYYKRKTLA